MNRRDLPTLLADLDDLMGRAKDAGVPQVTLDALHRARLALYLDSQGTERESVPPLFEANQPKRNAANEAFRNVRKILKDIR